ncbi:MAG TPA: CRTAC1 family protein [Verrucomicrobiae bacterium]
MKTKRNSLRIVSLVVTAGSTLLALGASADQFTNVTVAAGLVNEDTYCFGAAWGDYDNDNLVDLYIAVGNDVPRANALYRNNGNGTFTRIGAEAGPITTDLHDSCGTAWIDFNNDGYLDNLVENVGLAGPRIVLYRNNGNGTFNSSDGGLPSPPYIAYSWPACADYDGDGYVDFYLGEGNSTSEPFTLQLYRNKGNGTFTPTIALGPALSMVNGGAWGDYDNDGDPDLFVSNGPSPSTLWRNDGGGVFTAMNNGLPSSGNILHAAWADFDRDGDLDIALGTGATSLYRNNGTNGFAFVTSLTGARYSPAWADYDNDGHLDVVAAVGQSTPRNAALYHNNGDGTFTSVSDVFTRVPSNWLGSAWCDFNDDGFMDLLLTHRYGQIQLYQNLGNSNHWIKFKLVGTVSNRDALGAKVRVLATIRGEPVWQMQEVSCGDPNQSDIRLNFGLGDATAVDKVRIEWPSGVVEDFTNIAPRQILSIVEPNLKGSLGLDGKFHLAMTMSTTRLYQLQTSTDLVNWSVLTNCTGSGSCMPIEYVDSEAPAPGAARFYRLK